MINNKNVDKLTKNKKYSEVMHFMSMEELAELQQAISKKARGKKDNENLIEEIADSLICIDFLLHKYEIKESELNKVIDSKIDRMDRRLKNGTFINKYSIIQQSKIVKKKEKK